MHYCIVKKTFWGFEIQKVAMLHRLDPILHLAQRWRTTQRKDHCYFPADAAVVFTPSVQVV